MRYLFSVGCALILLSGTASAQVAKIFILEYEDAKTKKTVKLSQVPVVSESPAGIVIEPRRGQKRTIPALSINNARYLSSVLKDYLALSKPLNPADRAKNETDEKKRVAFYKESIELFPGVIEKVQGDRPVLRHLEYRFAETLYLWSKIDSAKRLEAETALKKFQKDHSDGWQITSALQMLASLQQAQGDVNGEMKTYQALADVEGLPKQMRWDALFSASNLLMRNDKLSEARTALKKLSTELPATSPEKSRVQMYLAQCDIAEGGTAAKKAVTEVQRLVARTSNKTLKALGHNTLAEHYIKSDQKEKAFWEVMRVHVMYPDDVDEHARALYHLSKLFLTVRQDSPRADECIEELKDARFAGTIYQKMAMQEKK